jgi:hypothetical protein
MKMKTCLTLVLAMAVLIGLMAPFAGACTVQGQAIGISNYYDTNTWDLWTIVYMKNTDSPFPYYAYYFITKDPALINLCNVALMTGRQIQIQGSAATCPG